MAEREEKKRKRSLLFSSEMTGMLLALFSIMGLLCLMTGESVFFTVGAAVQKFLLGITGYASYPILLFVLYLGIKMVVGFKTRVRGVKLGVTMFFVYLLLAGLIVQTATTHVRLSEKIPFGEYLSQCYYSSSAPRHTFGGALFALVAYPVSLLLTPVGSYVFYALNLILITVLVFRKRFKQFVADAGERRERRADEKAERELEKKTKEFETARMRAAARGVSGSVEYVKTDKRNSGRYGANEPKYYRNEANGDGAERGYGENLSGSDSKRGERGYENGLNSGENYPREFDGFGDSYHSGGLDGIYGNEKFNLKSKRDAQKNDDKERSLKLLFGNATSYGTSRSSNSYVYGENDGYRENVYGESENSREVRPSKSYQNDYDEDMAAKLDYIRRPVKPDYREAAKSPMGNDVPESVALRNADRMEDIDQSMPNRDVYVINDGKNSSKAGGGIRSFDLRSGRDRLGGDGYGETDRLGGLNNEYSAADNRGYNFSEGGDLTSGDSFESFENSRMAHNDETKSANDSFERLFGRDETYSSGDGSEDAASINGLKRVIRNAEDLSSDDARSNGADSGRLPGERIFGDGTSGGRGAAAADDFGRERERKSTIEQSESVLRGEQLGISGLANESGLGGEAGGSASAAKSVSDVSDDRKLINPIDAIPANYRYRFAPYNLMNDYRPAPEAIAETKRDVEVRKNIIYQVLAIAKIPAKIVDVKAGPAITRFELTIPDEISVKDVTKLQSDFNFRIAARGPIRIVAPIPGTSRVGIEVPNTTPTTVGLKGLVTDDSFKNAKKSSLTFCLGRDLVGGPVNLDISKMPHLLVAGATGTGKSVFLNTLLISLMYKYTPEELRIILVDPKIVEFSLFKGTPNLLFDEIITETSKACAMLDWACKEMDDRYRLLNENLVKNVDEYNTFMASKGGKPLYKILIIIDEFADLMATSNDKKNIENKISRIAAKARAAGIHLIMATQRPSVDIMEGSIKTNFTSRVAFKMSSSTDSQVIMGENGAEKLLGRGDVLYHTSSMMSTERAQGAFIDTPEIDAICRYLKEHNKCYYNEFALNEINKNIEKEAVDMANATDVLGGESGGDGNNKSDEEIVKNAMRLAINNKNISISMMQRRLGLGYPRAGKIMDILVDRKYVSDSLNSRNREINMTKEEFENVFGEPFDASQK